MNHRLAFSYLVSLVAITVGCTRTVPVGSLDGQRCAKIGDTVYVDDGCSACECTNENLWSCSESTCNNGAGGGTSYGTNPSYGGVAPYTSTHAVGGSTAHLTTSTLVRGGSTSTTPTMTCCAAQAVCAEGDTQISGPDSCPSNSTCYSNSLCCQTVWCAKKNPECTPGAWKRDSNDCVTQICIDPGFWANTLIECPSCKLGDKKTTADGCNICACDAEGNWSCTEKLCPIDCKLGETKKADDGCNTCQCGELGWRCTTNICSPTLCESGKVTYNTRRAELLNASSNYTCTKDTDCSLVIESNRCISNCGTAVASSVKSYLSVELTALGSSVCNSCEEAAVPLCLEQRAMCVDGRCVTGPVE
jgi:hypothetical protein